MRRYYFAVFLLALIGCSPDYPMDRPGTWSVGPVGANDANLRPMLARPGDLRYGSGERTSVGAEAARPIDRLFAGKRAELPATNASILYVTPGGSGGGNAGQ